VTITSASSNLVLSNLFITYGTTFIVDQSSVTILMRGPATLMANSDDHAGLECSAYSNISIAATYGGSLSATGGSLSAGFGTGAVQSCDHLQIVNGTDSLVGGTGSSLVNGVKILSWAGIGSGYGTGIPEVLTLGVYPFSEERS
jgi:hypothetical protein